MPLVCSIAVLYNILDFYRKYDVVVTWYVGYIIYPIYLSGVTQCFFLHYIINNYAYTFA